MPDDESKVARLNKNHWPHSLAVASYAYIGSATVRRPGRQKRARGSRLGCAREQLAAVPELKARSLSLTASYLERRTRAFGDEINSPGSYQCMVGQDPMKCEPCCFWPIADSRLLGCG